jgi:hypothetical protein
MWSSLLYRELGADGDVLKHPDYLHEAYVTGKGLVQAMKRENIK